MNKNNVLARMFLFLQCCFIYIYIYTHTHIYITMLMFLSPVSALHDKEPIKYVYGKCVLSIVHSVKRVI